MTRVHIRVRSAATVLLALLFGGCSHGEEIHFSRLEQVIFNTPTADLRDSLVARGDEFATPLLNVNPYDPQYMELLADFAADTSMRLIYHITDSLYHDLSWLERELGRALSRADGMHYDRFYTLVTGDFDDYNRRIFCSDHELAISLDHYAVGALKAGVPQYIEQLSRRQYMAADCMAAIARAHIALPDGDMTLLDYAIAEGKTLFFLEQTMPRTDDTILLRYTSQQLKWMRRNTEQVWSWLIKKQMLYSTDLLQFHNIIDEAPKTNAFGEESAPRTTSYIGWQIVRQYMRRTKCTMKELFENTDSRQILVQSGWRP